MKLHILQDKGINRIFEMYKKKSKPVLRTKYMVKFEHGSHLQCF